MRLKSISTVIVQHSFEAICYGVGKSEDFTVNIKCLKALSENCRSKIRLKNILNKT